MKERHWTNLVTSLRHGKCVLVLGPELAAQPATLALDTPTQVSYIDALRQLLARELEEDGLKVSAMSLAGVAQQYEDADAFGPGTLRSQAAKFYASEPLRPSSAHTAIA